MKKFVLKNIEVTEYSTEYILKHELNKILYGFVYITTDIWGINYIGQKKFNYGWENYLGSGTDFIKALGVFNKDKNCFIRRIVEFACTKEELNEKECEYINKFDAVRDPMFYNIATGGYGNPFANKTLDEIKEIGKKISESLKSKTKEELAKIRIQSNISRVNKNKIYVNANEKPIICITTGKIFSSASKASEKLNINRQGIIECLNGRQKYSGRDYLTGEKLVWEYYKDYNNIIIVKKTNDIKNVN